MNLLMLNSFSDVPKTIYFPSVGSELLSKPKHPERNVHSHSELPLPPGLLSVKLGGAEFSQDSEKCALVRQI